MVLKNLCGRVVFGLCLLVVVSTGLAVGLEDNPFLNPLFSDHVVLQREVRVPVWGWADPGTKVTVRLSTPSTRPEVAEGQEHSAVAGKDGKWMVYLRPMQACAEPRTMIVQDQSSNLKVEIKDILVGDVWICSGQSNMQMGIGECSMPFEVATADHPLIRLMTVPMRVSYTPEPTFDGEWLPCSPVNVLKKGGSGFSAVGYFFGRELHRELKIPIGMIHSAWGGTDCAAWTSLEGLKPLEDFEEKLAEVATMREALEAGANEKMIEDWYRAKDPGTSEEWFKPGTDASDWNQATMPQNWETCGLSNYDGIVWFQCGFDAPADWAGKELVLRLGPIDNIDTTWFNGVLVGQTERWDASRKYKVPGDAVKAGRNVIAVRVLDFFGLGGIYGEPEQLKIYPAGHESAAISLAGPWRFKDTVSKAESGPMPRRIGQSPDACTVVYNGMIAPLVPYAIKGAIWYQGEADAKRAYQYRTLLQTLIKDWRSKFDVGDFGFHIVSLPNYTKPHADPVDNDWAELREAQAMAPKALPNCGIAVTIDIGEAGTIHPDNKLDVGRRLALSALAITYGKKIEWSGPWYRSMKITDEGIRLEFDYVDGGLVVGGKTLMGFAVAGEAPSSPGSSGMASNTFVWADAVIDGDTVVVSSPKVPKPIAVRYGWDKNPVCNLYNKTGLPAVPFRTDDWPGITVNEK